MTDLIVCFAVTDQHIIIPLRITDTTHKYDDGVTLVKTEIDGDNSSHAECHHRIYFHELWFNKEGFPEKTNVFMNEQGARAYATNQATLALAQKQREVDELIKRLDELSTQ